MRDLVKGDKIRITDERGGHKFRIGEVVTIETVNTQGSFKASSMTHSYWLGSYECELEYSPRTRIKKEDVRHIVLTSIGVAIGWVIGKLVMEIFF